MTKKSQPIFKSIFGDNWTHLPPVMHKHYASRSYSSDIVTAQGYMDVEFGFLIKMLSPLLRWTGALVPYQGQNISVTVYFRSEPNSDALWYDRRFQFPERSPYVFKSKMKPINEKSVVEFMKTGIGWRHQYRFIDDKVILEHQGYVWNAGGKIFPLPLGWLIGSVYAEEQSIDDFNFKMKMTINHPVFGKLYEYRGKFCITEIMTDANNNE